MKKYCMNYDKTQYENITLKFNCVKSVEAVYIKQTEPLDIGNDLIEALIPIKSKDESINDFEYRPYISPHERELPLEKRSMAVLRLDQYRIGRDYTYLIDREIEIALRRCYRARKKFNLDKLSTLDETGKYFTDCEYKKIEGQKTQGFTIIGISGGGKTTSLSSSLYNYPQVIYHTTENSRCLQIVYIKVECPPDGSVKSFYSSCLEALEEASGREINLNKDKMTIAEKERLFKKLALRWNLGMLVIEEIQQLSIKKVETMNQFLTLANDTQIPIVYVGTFKALNRIFGVDFRLARRLGNEITVRRYEKNLMWDDMLEDLWQYQWLKELIPLTNKLKEAFYFETAGIIDRVITLFEAMQLEALLSGTESVNDITPAFLQRVSKKYFTTTRSVLNDLSMGIDNIDTWDDIYDRTKDKNTVKEVADELERRRASALIIDKNRKINNLTIDSLRNNIITNINITFGDIYSQKDIEKAFEFLKKKNKHSLIDTDETQINYMIIDLLIHPDYMIKKPEKKEQVDDFDLPMLDGLI